MSPNRFILILLASAAFLAGGVRGAVIQTFSDELNIPNYTGGTTLGSFSVSGTPDLYLAFTLDWISGTEGANKFVVMYFGSQNSGVNFGLKSNQGPNLGGGATDWVMRFGSSSPIAYAPDQVSVPSTTRIVGRIQDTNNNGDYDAAALWINPTAGDLGSPSATISGFAMTISPSPLGLRSVNLAPEDDIDLLDIVVTDDFGSAVPEPSSVGLIGLSATFLLLRRRRSA